MLIPHLPDVLLYSPYSILFPNIVRLLIEFQSYAFILLFWFRAICLCVFYFAYWFVKCVLRNE